MVNYNNLDVHIRIYLVLLIIITMIYLIVYLLINFTYIRVGIEYMSNFIDKLLFTIK